MSLYFGLSSGLQQLEVSSVNVELVDNEFEGCTARVSTELGGNSYGGAVSIYIGGYSSVWNASTAAALAGGTAARNVSVALHGARFSSCIVERSSYYNSTYGASVFGGSFSLYIGAYAWSYSRDGSSSSTIGAITASYISVSINYAPSFDCRAVTSSRRDSLGASSYGGSMSVLYVGAYAWSYSDYSISSSASDYTAISAVSVSVSDAGCSNCRAATSSQGFSDGTNSYGGSMSVLYVGAYA